MGAGGSLGGNTSTSIKIKYILTISTQSSQTSPTQVIEIPIQIFSPLPSKLHKKKRKNVVGFLVFIYIFYVIMIALSSVNCITSSHVLPSDLGSSIRVSLKDQIAVSSLFNCRGKTVINGVKEASYDLLSLRDNFNNSITSLDSYASSLSSFLPPELCYKQPKIQENIEEIEVNSENEKVTYALWDLHRKYYQNQNNLGLFPHNFLIFFKF